MNKRGLSTVVISSILIFLIIVVIITIVLVVVKNIIGGESEEIALEELTGLVIENAYISDTGIKVDVKRSSGSGEITGVKFSFYNETDSIVIEKNISLLELEERTFTFTSSELPGITSDYEVSVAPIYLLDSGKLNTGDVTDTKDIASEPPPADKIDDVDRVISPTGGGGGGSGGGGGGGAITPSDTTPPSISNGQPSGILPYGTTQTIMNVTTNENAKCRWSTTANQTSALMANNFLITGGTLHSVNITGLQNGQSYNYYIWCYDSAGNANTNDYQISFSVSTIVVPTLSVKLTAFPSSGREPLNNVDLTADVTGTAKGLINYTFYCDRSDSNTNITIPYSAQFNNIVTNPQTVTDLCFYTNQGTYTAKVIVERDTVTTESRVTISVTDGTSPTRSGGSPTGTLSAGTTSTTMRVTTDEAATCRYSTTAGVSYSSMTNTFISIDGTSHSTTITGLQDGQDYNRYVRCRDAASNENTNDYTISFSVASITTPPSGEILFESSWNYATGTSDNAMLDGLPGNRPWDYHFGSDLSIMPWEIIASDTVGIYGGAIEHPGGDNAYSAGQREER